MVERVSGQVCLSRMHRINIVCLLENCRSHGVQDCRELWSLVLSVAFNHHFVWLLCACLFFLLLFLPLLIIYFVYSLAECMSKRRNRLSVPIFIVFAIAKAKRAICFECNKGAPALSLKHLFGARKNFEWSVSRSARSPLWSSVSVNAFILLIVVVVNRF